MKVLFINSVCGIGSTGRICTDLALDLESQGHEVRIAYGRNGIVPNQYKHLGVRIGSDLGVRLHGLKSRIFDSHGLGSTWATRKFLKWVDDYKPDMIWLHNIHGYYINYELLFDWIKRHPQIQVKWTLHDCWAFTGHCAYFTLAACEKWKTGCSKCPQPHKYPARYFIDNSARNYEKKKCAFSGIAKMTIITPSKWLANLVKESFLREYPVQVVYNSIDTDVFKPTESDFRKKYGLEDKKLVLGVASPWDERKGLEDFLWLSEHLDDQYRIILVGLTEKQISRLPTNIIGIKRTDSARELAAIYSAVDVFVNPTHEDNYPTTNLEAQACGTPVITYRVGGSQESVLPENVIDENNRESLLERVIQLAKTNEKETM